MTDDSSSPATPADWRSAVRATGPTGGPAIRCHLVVGFDSHRASHAALRYAIDLAARLDGLLHVAHIVDTDDLPIDPDAADWEQAIADTVAEVRREADTILARATAPWTYYSRPGRPAQLLAELADAHDAEMIIIGAARGGLLSLLERVLGESVSTSLTHHTHRPVLLVPPHTDTYTG